MEEALGAIRRVFAEEQAREQTLANAEQRPSDEDTKTKVTPGAGLLSREATVAVTSAVSRLTENVKKHEPTLEEVVREALRPVLRSWLEENLPNVVERMVRAEIERVIR